MCVYVISVLGGRGYINLLIDWGFSSRIIGGKAQVNILTLFF